MTMLGGALSTLAQGARIASALSNSETALNAYDRGSEKMDSLNNRAQAINNGIDKAVGLDHLLRNNDLAEYPNLHNAMEHPEGRALVGEAYRSMNRGTPFKQREALQEVMGPSPGPKIETYNYHPGPSDSADDAGRVDLPIRSG